jgi:hypothetical protein
MTNTVTLCFIRPVWRGGPGVGVIPVGEKDEKFSPYYVQLRDVVETGRE